MNGDGDEVEVGQPLFSVDAAGVATAGSAPKAAEAHKSESAGKSMSKI